MLLASNMWQVLFGFLLFGYLNEEFYNVQLKTHN